MMTGHLMKDNKRAWLRHSTAIRVYEWVQIVCIIIVAHILAAHAVCEYL